MQRSSVKDLYLKQVELNLHSRIIRLPQDADLKTALSQFGRQPSLNDGRPILGLHQLYSKVETKKRYIIQQVDGLAILMNFIH